METGAYFAVLPSGRRLELAHSRRAHAKRLEGFLELRKHDLLQAVLAVPGVVEM